MQDLISRQAVLDGLASIAKGKAKSDKQKALMGRTIFFVEQLPSVTPQEPKTEWQNIEDPPEDDRLILLSFANYPIPAIGRYVGSEEEGGAFYIDSAKESLSSIGLIVNGWQELPKCRRDDYE